MLIGRATEWLPTPGVSWHVVHDPAIAARPSASFSPPDIRDADGERVEDHGAPRDRRPRGVTGASPCVEKGHRRPIERVAEHVGPEHVVDRYVISAAGPGTPALPGLPASRASRPRDPRVARSLGSSRSRRSRPAGPRSGRQHCLRVPRRRVVGLVPEVGEQVPREQVELVGDRGGPVSA